MEMSPVIVTMLSFGIVGLVCLAVAEKFIPIFPSYVLLMFVGMTAKGGLNLTAIIAATTIDRRLVLCSGMGLGARLAHIGSSD